MKREHMKQLCYTAQRETSACAASGDVFCLHLPSRARNSLLSVPEMSNKKNRLTCQVVWRFKKSVLTRSSPAICANLVVLAVGVVLPIVGVLPIVAVSTVSLTMTITTAPVFHGYDSIAGIRLGVVSVTAR